MRRNLRIRKLIRVYLYIIDIHNGIEVFESFDLDEILQIWKNVEDGLVAGVIHVCFNRLSHTHAKLPSELRGKLFLSRSARLAISSEEDVLDVDTNVTWLGLSLSIAATETTNVDKLAKQRDDIPNWIECYASVDKNVAESLRKQSIRSDADYIEREKLLDRATRIRVALYRLSAALTDDLRLDIASRNLPPWLEHYPMLRMTLPIAMRKLVRANSVITLGNLRNLDWKELLEARDIGKNSIRKTVQNIRYLIEQGPEVEFARKPAVQMRTSFLSMVNEKLTQLGEVERRIMMLRGGIEQDPLSRTEVASLFSLSRERVRQYELQCLEKLRTFSDIIDYVRESFNIVRRERTSPIFLDEIEEYIPAIKGEHESDESFKYFLGNLFRYDIFMIEIDNGIILANMGADKLKDLVQAIRFEVSVLLKQGGSLHECQQLVYDLIPENISEFRDTIWEAIKSNSTPQLVRTKTGNA